MAALSGQSSPYGSPAGPSPTTKGLKSLLSVSRRSSEIPTENSLRTDSIDALNLDKPLTRQSSHSSPSRDGSYQSSSSGMRKLIPGHSKRKRRKIREQELRAAAEQMTTSSATTLTSPPNASTKPESELTHDGENSLLTDDSDVENSPPPLVSRDSHTGYLTMSSPLISKTAVRDGDVKSDTKRTASEGIPTLVEPERTQSSPSPRTAPITEPAPVIPMSGLTDRAESLRPDSRSSSISKIRGKSPVRRFKDVFSSKPSKSPRTSPERPPTDVSGVLTNPFRRESTISKEESGLEHSSDGSAVKMSSEGRVLTGSKSTLNTEERPLTPPAAVMDAPVTTITPPTPTDNQFGNSNKSQPSGTDLGLAKNEDSGVVVSPSGNMISHRRTRSTSSVTHQPSKLSNSMTVPLTPMTEETRTASSQIPAIRTPSGSFFSSWVSAAQNAASSITSLTAQNRSRSGTTSSDPAPLPSIHDPIEEEERETTVPDTPKKQLAIDTLGTGDLSFSHLGLQTDENSNANSDSADMRKDPTIQKDEASAKVEDMLAKRAVSAAYERSIDVTPVAEIPDPIQSVRYSQTFGSGVGGDSTPPNGSIFESEAGSIRRSNSVRSKLATRRNRGSSSATGQSAIGAMIGASTATLANPATGPRISGFAMAPKQRNRNFHQQFRSVPEDDFLIEDYSCALQKEILLAGRIYISEGHICFSSNILGWVTTLVISFEEIVSIEKENTALVIPNAIAIQTLHARHTFRSLLSREATYDLLIGIWKVSHPASFLKSVNGKALAANETKEEVAEVVAEATGAHESEESSEDSNSEADDGSTPSVPGSGASIAGSDIERKPLSRKVSMMNGSTTATTPPANAASGVGGDISPAVATVAGAPESANDFPGPTNHAPTECTDSATHYEKIIKDEVIHAPLGKVYSLLYGPLSGTFVKKYLQDDCKSIDLVFEDDKKGLNNETKSRQYTYIKPLGGSIGPKQTKCITTENLDFFDLEKAVSVTCTTQTPDVPSGNAFSTKTRYCLTWAAGNATRLQMNCTIEWTAKSWLKGPIEKGAGDGQQQYGDGLVKVLKAAVGRPRGTTTASKVSKVKKRRKGEKKEKEGKSEAESKKAEDWGLLEPLRGPLGPVVDIFQPIIKTELVVGLLFIMVMILWLRGSSGTGISLPGNQLGRVDRLVAYEELWQREESELWNWLESRTGVDRAILGDNTNEKSHTGAKAPNSRQRQKVLNSKDVEAKLREEKMSEREMNEAIRVTKERLEVLEAVINKKKATAP